MGIEIGQAVLLIIIGLASVALLPLWIFLLIVLMPLWTLVLLCGVSSTTLAIGVILSIVWFIILTFNPWEN